VSYDGCYLIFVEPFEEPDGQISGAPMCKCPYPLRVDHAYGYAKLRLERCDVRRKACVIRLFFAREAVSNEAEREQPE
jgi:hypothetical protein